MRKVTTFLTAALCLAWVGAKAQSAPDAFKDVDRGHWAYEATDSLRSKGILIGYPDGYFRGPRTLTRYEFAVALDRALKTIGTIKGDKGDQGEAGAAGEAGPAGETGEAGEVGPPGVTPEELETFKRLADEFKNELASLGNNMKAVNAKLDALTKDVADINDRLSKMPKVYGGAWFGFRNNAGTLSGFDRDGRPLSLSDTLVHQFVLGVKANIEGGVTLDAALTSNTYKNYLGGDLALPYLPLYSGAPADTYVRRLEISAPLSALGRDGKLTVGRFDHNVSHLTFWKPDVDTYFNNPFERNGMYTIDGAKLDTNFGSVSVQAFGAQTKSVTGSASGYGYMSSKVASRGYGYGYGFGSINTPLAGAPDGVGLLTSRSSLTMAVEELVGVNMGLNIHQMKGGHFRLSALDVNGEGPGYNNVLIYGADTNINLTDRLSFTGDWAMTAIGRRNGFKTYASHQNMAFDGGFGYKSGAFNINAGYRYIDPLFYAPGYWGKIGQTVNPTNIQGPTFRASYDFSPSVGVNVGGDFYSAVRNRNLQGGITRNDDINRILAGIRWDLSSSFRTTVDWEGVYYSVAPGTLGATGRTHPTEHYVTIGTGYNLTSSTQIKMGYQLGAVDSHSLLSGGKYNFNTFTSEVAVKF